MYVVWAEWDVGEEGLLFTSKTKAENWIKNNEILKGLIEEEGGKDPLEFIDLGLVGIKYWEIVS